MRGMVMSLTYWAPNGSDRYGKMQFAAPITVNGRWEDKQQEFISPTGDTLTSKSVAYALQPILIDGYLYNGTSAASDPRSVTGARQVRQSLRVPSLSTLEEVVQAIM